MEEKYDLVQLEQYIMTLCTFRSDTCYSVFISILSLKAFSLKILQFTQRAYIEHIPIYNWKQICVIIEICQDMLHMFSSQCKCCILL